MKLLVRIVLGLVGLVIVVCAALVLLLPRLIDSPEFRQAVTDMSTESIGRPLEYDSLSVGLLPLSVMVEGARIAGHAPDEAPLLSTDSIALHISLLPLLQGEVHVDSLLINGARVHLVQMEEGLLLPTPPQPDAALEDPATPAEDAGESPISLAIREVALRDAALVLEDRTATPAIRHEIEALEIVARGGGPGALVQVEASARPRAGAGSGMVLKGQITFAMTLSPDFANPSGEFELDFSELDVDYAGVFKKPAGMPAGAVGRFAVAPSGEVRVDLGRLTLHEFVASGTLKVAEQTRLVLSAEPFGLAGWDAVLPALEPHQPGGSVGLEDFSVVVDPLALGGRIALKDVTLQVPDADAITIRGAIAGRGDAIELDGLSVEVGGQQIALGGGVRDLMGDLPFDFTLESVGVLRSNPLMSALTPLRDTLYGPLVIEGRLRGRARAEGETGLTDSLKGYLAFNVGRGVGDGSEGGRLTGISLLKSAMGELEKVGSAALRIAARRSGVDIESYTGDAFERLDGRFVLGDGRLDTKDLRIVYRGYGVNLRGSVGMSEQDLDMTGELELEKEVAELLGAEPSGDRLVVPLAHVGGSVENPELALSEDAVKAILADNKEVKKAKRQLRGLIRRKLRESRSDDD
jgi:hypothetical protein